MRKELFHFALFALAVCALVALSSLSRWARAEDDGRRLVQGGDMLHLIRKIAETCEGEVALLRMLGKHGALEDCMRHYSAEGDRVIAGQQGISPWRGLRAMRQFCRQVWLDGCADIYAATGLRW